MNYALITARKGSKGIKNKNLKKIGKISLIERSIINAKKSNLFDKIFCTSDSKKILNISSKNEIISISRPNKISQDSSLSIDAVIHFYNFLKEKKIKLPEIVFLFQPTSPFIKKDTIEEMINIYKKYPSTKSVISIYEVNNKYHYINQRKLEKDKTIKFLFEKERNKKVRRQDKPKVYVHGNLFSFKIKDLIKQNSITPKPIRSVELKNFYECIDIDNHQDYELTKLIFNNFSID